MRLLVFIFFTWMCFQIPMGLTGQALLDQHVEIRAEAQPLSSALVKLSRQEGLNILFSNTLSDQVRIRETAYAGSLRNLLELWIPAGQLAYEVVGVQIVLYPLKVPPVTHAISGYIGDAASGEPLAGAIVTELNTGKQAITNRYGFYTLSTDQSRANIEVRCLGFHSDLRSLSIQADTRLDIQLSHVAILLDEVVISDSDGQGTLERLMAGQFSSHEIARTSRLGGEADIFRFAEFLPGVGSGADGVGGLNIRGGTSDQNLVLMDGVPIYSPAHAIGILSIFNPATVREVKLYKAGIPARYSGRLSAVLDVTTKEGNLKNWSAQGHIGPIAGSLLVEGPIVRDKSSLIISARHFLPDLFLRGITRKYKARDALDGFARYRFYDINVKWQTRLGRNDRIYVSYYKGSDDYSDVTIRERYPGNNYLREEFNKSLDWGNAVAILRWNRQLAPKMFLKTTASLSQFGLTSSEKNRFEGFNTQQDLRFSGFDQRYFESRIDDLSLKFDIDYVVNGQHALHFGAYLTRHHFRPKSISLNEQSKVENINIQEGILDDTLFNQFGVIADEVGVYIEDRFRISEGLMIESGFHISGLTVAQKTYINPQPRVRLSYTPRQDMHLAVEGGIMVQYLHLLTNSGIGMPTDLWVPVTENVRPQTAAQVSADYTWQCTALLSVGISGYFKWMNHLITYREGASFLLQEGLIETSIIDAVDWENKITQGKGRAYGIEVTGAYHPGKADLWFAYTLSRSDRQFDAINFGQSFPFRYDRTHSLSLNGSWSISKHFDFSVQWVYGSGNPITLAESKYLNAGTALLPIFVDQNGDRVSFLSRTGINYSAKNGYRMPDYHRLDLSLNAEFKTKQTEHALHLNIYNVYNRQNPFYISFLENEEGAFEATQFTILPLVPSLSYSIKF